MKDPNPSSSSSSLPAAPPRMVLLLVDNAAAFQCQTRRQGINYAGIGAGLYSKERAAIGAGVSNEFVGKNPPSSSNWFMELFTHRLRYLINTYHLIGIVSKPTMAQVQVSYQNNPCVTCMRACCVRSVWCCCWLCLVVILSHTHPSDPWSHPPFLCFVLLIPFRSFPQPGECDHV